MTLLETEKALLMSWISDHTDIEPVIAIGKKAIIEGITFFTKQDYPDTLFSIPLEQVLEELREPDEYDKHIKAFLSILVADDIHLAALRLLKRVKEGEKDAK